MILGILLGAFVSVIFIWMLPRIPKPTKLKRIGIIGQYDKNNLPFNIRSKISQGLTISLKDGSIKPLLAEKWTISGDGKEYVFYLRDDIKWQDGTKLTTKDLDYKFTDVDVIKKDDKTIIFKLKSEKSFAPFPLILNQPIFKKNLVGTGEYIVRQLKESNGLVKSIRLEKENEALYYKTYTTLSMAKMAFMMGEIDEIHDINSDPFEYDNDWKNVVDVYFEKNDYVHVALFFNLENDLFKDNKALRQALAYATRKPKNDNRATGPISTISWAYNTEVKQYDFEPKRANELAEKSLGNISKVKELNLKISTTNSLLVQAEEIKRDWEEVFGCNVEIEIVNNLDPNYQILLASQEIPSDPDQYALWHSTQEWPTNIVNLKNPRIDKLLEEGRTEIDEEVRKEYYFDFQKYFVEEMPIVFLYYPNSYKIVRKSTVKNYISKLM